jgi:hypothetical protein
VQVRGREIDESFPVSSELRESREDHSRVGFIRLDEKREGGWGAVAANQISKPWRRVRGRRRTAGRRDLGAEEIVTGATGAGRRPPRRSDTGYPSGIESQSRLNRTDVPQGPPDLVACILETRLGAATAGERQEPCQDHSKAPMALGHAHEDTTTIICVERSTDWTRQPPVF